MLLILFLAILGLHECENGEFNPSMVFKANIYSVPWT